MAMSRRATRTWSPSRLQSCSAYSMSLHGCRHQDSSQEELKYGLNPTKPWALGTARLCDNFQHINMHWGLTVHRKQTWSQWRAFFFKNSLIHMCIRCLGRLLPLSAPRPSPSYLSHFQAELFCSGEHSLAFSHVIFLSYWFLEFLEGNYSVSFAYFFLFVQE
jgi:hypothetical protein